MDERGDEGGSGGGESGERDKREEDVEMKGSAEDCPGPAGDAAKATAASGEKNEEVEPDDDEKCPGPGPSGEVMRKKNLSGSHKRNYRSSHCRTSDEEEEEPKSSSPRLDAGMSANENESSNHTMPMSPSSTTESAGAEHEDSDNDEGSDHGRSDRNNQPEDHFPAGIAFYPGGIELSSDDDTSSSSLSMMEEEEEEDSSSDSSDSLADLEDSATREPSNNCSTARKKGESSGKTGKKKDQPLPKVLQKPKAKSKWNAPKELFRREMGYSSRSQPQSFEIFRSKFYGSLFSAERLELMKKLDGHEGCVNCLNFSYSGSKLISGSDDLQIKMWNYGLGVLMTSFHSKHRSNVFQAKFMPLIGLDNIIVTCARDSTVRLSELDSTGSVVSSRKLAQHRGPVHKLTVNPETPHIALSCGEDGAVFSCDIREDKADKLLTVTENDRKVPLYSISGNPLLSHEFCVSGRDEYVRIYDTRKLSRTNEEGEEKPTPLKRFCPHHLQGHQSKPHITAAVYNYDGTEIIASYNDENIYMFDTSHSDMADYIKSFEGHLNSATVKGVNYFGDRSQFVVSGSDCGHVFLWDKESESIVNFFRGDENGVVNCLEPHPTAPILATSGLDDDVKIWIPSSEMAPKMGDLAPTVRKNIKRRMEEMESRPNALDGQLMWQLMHHIHREQQRRNRVSGLADSDTSSDDDDDEDGDASRMDCVIA